MGQVYRLDFINGKFYVGVAKKSAKKRFENHRKAAEKLDTLLYRAWRKHGQPILAMVEDVDNEHLFTAEVAWIVKYNSKHPYGYNMNDGGIGGLNPTEETRVKLRAAQKGNNKFLGHRHTPESCAKNRDTQYANKLRRFEALEAKVRKLANVSEADDYVLTFEDVERMVAALESLKEPKK